MDQTNGTAATATPDRIEQALSSVDYRIYVAARDKYQGIVGEGDQERRDAFHAYFSDDDIQGRYVALSKALEDKWHNDVSFVRAVDSVLFPGGAPQVAPMPEAQTPVRVKPEITLVHPPEPEGSGQDAGQSDAGNQDEGSDGGEDDDEAQEEQPEPDPYLQYATPEGYLTADQSRQLKEQYGAGLNHVARPDYRGYFDAAFPAFGHEYLENLIKHDDSQDSNVAIYNAYNYGKVLYEELTHRWYVYEGHNWELDPTLDKVARAIGQVKKLFEEFGSWYEQEIPKRIEWLHSNVDDAKEIKAKTKAILDVRDKIQRRIENLGGNRYKNDVIACLTRNSDHTEIILDKPYMDSNPYLIAFDNGVLDLTTGDFRDGRPDDFISSRIKTEWKGFCHKGTHFEKFCRQLVGYNDEIYSFWQRIMGSGLYGIQTEEAALVMIGAKGSNGKSTFLNAIRNAIGDDYFKSLRSGTLTIQKNKNDKGGPRSDLAQLDNCRYAVSSEMEGNERLDEVTVKKLISGGEPIPCRAPYDKFEFSVIPKFLLIISANDIPWIDPTSDAIWRRLFFIAFKHSFYDPDSAFYRDDDPFIHPLDVTLKEKIMSDKAAVISWLVEGAINHYKIGLHAPAAVQVTTQEQRESGDQFGEFLSEFIEVLPMAERNNAKVLVGEDLMPLYTLYCNIRLNRTAPKQRELTKNLKHHEIETKKIHTTQGNKTFALGIRIKEDALKKLQAEKDDRQPRGVGKQYD